MSRITLLLCGAGALAFLNLGCNSTKFTSKQAALSKSVMGNEAAGALRQTGIGNGIQNNEGSGVVSQPGQGDDGDGVVNQPPGTDPGAGTVKQPDGTNDEVDLTLICSDRLSKDQPNYKGAIAAGKPIVLALDGKICTSDAKVIQSIVDKRTFTLADAKQICPPLVPASGKWRSVEIIIDGVSTPAVKGVVSLLYARNNDESVPAEAADDNCDKMKSPLVVHVSSDPENPQAIALSSRENGVFFDLLGSLNRHKAVKISWFTNLEYRLLSLPNRIGQVNGIDELFGDSTLGPDRRFADNGYEALAKYDGRSADGRVRLARPDGYITRADAVFDRLRLWLDSNFDGVAQPSELASLQSEGISYIDLDYSSDYAEFDPHGNETKMKSVIGYEDGNLDLIFDLWFRVDRADLVGH
ncbi:MAG: hypothetical protein AB7F86_14040 [Bdellovibrionales bacterium]